jgi:hypothetical protein
MDLFSLFRPPANPFQAAVSHREYKEFSDHYRLLPYEHKQAILLFVKSGMSAKQAFRTLWAILLSPNVNDDNFMEVVQDNIIRPKQRPD